MPDRREELVRKMIAEGTSDDDIRATLKAYDAQQPAKPSETPSKIGMSDVVTAVTAALHGIPGLSSMLGEHDPTVMNAVRENPVAAGAMIGGAVAAPLTGGASIPAAAAAAGLGSAGGAGLGSILNAAVGNESGPRTATDVAKAMASEGAAGMIGEGVGQGLQKLARGAGKLIYKTALRPSMPLQREFGDVAATGLREGRIVSQGGAAANEAALNKSAAEAKRLITAAAPTASPVRVITEVGKETIPIVQRAGLRASTGLPDESAGIVTRIRGMQQANPGGIPLERAQAMKGELQDLANTVYRAQDKGAPVIDLGADTNAAMARGLRQAIESRVPDVAPVNARTQELIGLQRAVEDATRRNVPGVGSLRTLLGDFMPSIASAGGIALDRAGRSGVAPLTLRSALIAALGGQPQEEP